MFFTNRTTGVSRVCPLLERVDAGGRRSCWSFLRMSEGTGRATFAMLFFEPSGEES